MASWRRLKVLRCAGRDGIRDDDRLYATAAAVAL